MWASTAWHTGTTGLPYAWELALAALSSLSSCVGLAAGKQCILLLVLHCCRACTMHGISAPRGHQCPHPYLSTLPCLKVKEIFAFTHFPSIFLLYSNPPSPPLPSPSSRPSSDHLCILPVHPRLHHMRWVSCSGLIIDASHLHFHFRPTPSSPPPLPQAPLLQAPSVYDPVPQPPCTGPCRPLRLTAYWTTPTTRQSMAPATRHPPSPPSLALAMIAYRPCVRIRRQAIRRLQRALSGNASCSQRRS